MLFIVSIFIGILYFFQDRLIFYPQTVSESESERIADEHKRAEEVSFSTADGEQLHGWLLHPADADQKAAPLLIYYGGNAEELSSQIAPMSANLTDWSVLLVNYRGYGRSGGSPGEQALYNDAIMIFDEIHEQLGHTEISSTVLMGRSLGGSIATKVASERQVDGMVLISPFDTLTNVAKIHYPFLPVSWLLKYSFNSLESAPDISVPLLALAAKNDDIIPPERTKTLIANWDGPVQFELIENRHHNDIHMDSQFWNVITEFLETKPD